MVGSLGSLSHQAGVTSAVTDLRRQGWRVAELNGLAPTFVGTDALQRVLAIVLRPKRPIRRRGERRWDAKHTVASLQRRYSAFDSVLTHVYRIEPGQRARDRYREELGRAKKMFAAQGVRLVHLARKCPDFVAVGANGQVVAGEVLRFSKEPTPCAWERAVALKRVYYGGFDDIFVFKKVD